MQLFLHAALVELMLCHTVHIFEIPPSSGAKIIDFPAVFQLRSCAYWCMETLMRQGNTDRSAGISSTAVTLLKDATGTEGA